MECTTVCNDEVIRCLKDKISQTRNVDEIAKLIEHDKIPKIYEVNIMFFFVLHAFYTKKRITNIAHVPYRAVLYENGA